MSNVIKMFKVNEAFNKIKNNPNLNNLEKYCDLLKLFEKYEEEKIDEIFKLIKEKITKK